MYRIIAGRRRRGEILVVNDGSSDRTAQIADEYAAKYPTIVKATSRRTEAMVQQSMQESEMQQDCISRLWTVMTG